MDLIWLKSNKNTILNSFNSIRLKIKMCWAKIESFFLVLQFSGWNLQKLLQSSQIVPVHLVAEFPASRTHTNNNSQTSTHTHTQGRIHMDHTVPKGPNQLGQLSEMYSLAKALYPYLQQYPITAKLSVPCIVLCWSPCSSPPLRRICSSPSQGASFHISL